MTDPRTRMTVPGAGPPTISSRPVITPRRSLVLERHAVPVEEHSTKITKIFDPTTRRRRIPNSPTAHYGEEPVRPGTSSSRSHDSPVRRGKRAGWSASAERPRSGVGDFAFQEPNQRPADLHERRFCRPCSPEAGRIGGRNRRNHRFNPVRWSAHRARRTPFECRRPLAAGLQGLSTFQGARNVF